MLDTGIYRWHNSDQCSQRAGLCRAYSVRQEPRRFLSDADVTREFRAGCSLEADAYQEYCHQPLPVAQFATFHQCADSNAEQLFTSLTSIGHGVVGRHDGF